MHSRYLFLRIVHALPNCIDLLSQAFLSQLEGLFYFPQSHKISMHQLNLVLLLRIFLFARLQVDLELNHFALQRVYLSHQFKLGLLLIHIYLKLHEFIVQGLIAV